MWRNLVESRYKEAEKICRVYYLGFEKGIRAFLGDMK
jgi:hypothetical protein